mgnify:CR=1 FL=1
MKTVEIECAMRFKTVDDCERIVVERSSGIDDVPAWFGRTIADALVAMGRQDTDVIVAYLAEWIAENDRELGIRKDAIYGKHVLAMFEAASSVCAMYRQTLSGR